VAVPLPLIQLMARRFYDAVEIHQPPQYIGVEPVDPQQGVAFEVRLAKSRPCRHRFGRMLLFQCLPSSLSPPASLFMLEIYRRSAIASAVYHPCLRAFLFPFGAPGDGPPCIRQRPFGIAGDWHGLSLRVFAPQRRLR
jgi:hypothetical protein